jgi:hypothetical protein
MRKTTLNFLVDALALAACALLAGTGALIRWILPPGSGHSRTLWGLGRHDWGTIHFWIAVAFAAAVALHLALHWRWVAAVVKGPDPRRARPRVALAIVLTLALAALALAPLFGTVRTIPGAPKDARAHESHEEHSEEIQGFMTLREVEQRTGVPADVIIRELDLPPDTSLDARLGPLRREHGFELQRVREIVRSWSPKPQPDKTVP